MKVYFYTPEAGDTAAAHTHRAIADVLERSGVSVIVKDTPIEQAFPDIYRQLERRGQSLLDFVDAVVIEGSEPDPEVGYLLAYAVAQRKPALLLLRKGRAVKNPLATFGRNVPKNLTTAIYTEDSIEGAVIGFMSSLGTLEYQEVPSIKFTLRITPQIEQYLDWKTHNTKKTKADFLRAVILDDIIARDEEFQRYWRKRRTR